MSNQAVEISVGGTLNVEVTTADIVAGGIRHDRLSDNDPTRMLGSKAFDKQYNAINLQSLVVKTERAVGVL